MNSFGLYIHIPFCESKCYYCDFNSYSNKIGTVDKYITYLIKELSLYKDLLSKYNLETIFIGGGTPSLINPKYIYKVLDYVYKNYNTSYLKEISIESNPNSLQKNKLKTYKNININRISMGLQSYNNEMLKKIGRVHNVDQFVESFYNAREIGFDNINVDIMFNLPNQTKDDVLYTLKNVSDLSPEHISFYSLKLEKGTKFYNDYNNNTFNLPSEEYERNVYKEGIRYLKEKDYFQYEISNFSKNGYECKHNMFYWELKPYLGVGLGAHSNLLNKRWGNLVHFNDYFNKINLNEYPLEEEETINKDMEMSEYLILGLRLNKGISKYKFKDRFKKDLLHIYGKQIDKLVKNELIKIDNEIIKLTSKGIDLSNQVFIELLP